MNTSWVVKIRCPVVHLQYSFRRNGARCKEGCLWQFQQSSLPRYCVWLITDYSPRCLFFLSFFRAIRFRSWSSCLILSRCSICRCCSFVGNIFLGSFSYCQFVRDCAGMLKDILFVHGEYKAQFLHPTTYIASPPVALSVYARNCSTISFSWTDFFFIQVILLTTTSFLVTFPLFP